ncbi:hypothetical protein BHM03_00007356 [Ensete ventricosum]|nr:hypothetical protein BHM03_00007356 [Ensete ventricosum]
MPRLPSSHSLWTLEASRTDITAAETHAKVVRDPLPRPPPHPPSSKKMEKKKREKKGENLESGAALPILIRRPRAISSPRAGRRNVSLCGEKEQGDVTLFRQVTDTRTARYRAVPSKIDHRRPIEEEIDRRRSIEEEKGKKKRKRKKKRRGEERIPRPPAVAARCRRQRVACGRGRSRFFSRARRRSVSPVHTAWYGSCTGTDNMSVYWYGLMPEVNHLNMTPREAVTMTQEVVKTMLAKGYQLSKDALIKAKAFDESHHVTATAAAMVADLSNRSGLTDKINAGLTAVTSVDERYHLSATTKSVVSATTRTAASITNSVVSSSYFSAGALLVSDALNKAAKVAADLATHSTKR